VSGPPTNGNGRLDSWKAIAAYLNRDERTVRRWERDSGLPVRRVPGGRGTSVFAYTHEIDDWLRNSPPQSRTNGETNHEAAGNGGPARSRAWLVASAAILIALVGGAAWFMPFRAAAEGLRLDATADGVIAFDRTGVERWRYRFAATHKTVLADGDGVPVLMAGGGRPAVFLATSFRARTADGLTEGGTLTELTAGGRLVREFAFDDRVRLGGVDYAAPWAISAFAVDDSRGRRVAVAAHHHVWGASLVTILDEDWQRRGTFVHSGWIESVRWLSPDRLLIAGYSDAHAGGMVALLDANALDGQGPEPKGSPHFCEGCGDGAPLKMVVMPRTELNLATVSRFNRAIVQITATGILARPIEVPSAGQDAVDALYEFTAALELTRASFSVRYWEVHRALEEQGQLKHSRASCPDRDGPRAIERWDPGAGWRTVTIS
jgi:hypothetical protein